MIRKKTILALTLILLLFAPEVMYAQSSFGDTASKFFGGVIEVFTVLNWLALAVVQALLNPDFIFGVKNAGSGIRPMEIILNQIWIVSRDIVNGIFAFMLLGFGIYMIIFGAEKGVGATFKEKAPKFVLAVVLVNFSWFFPRVILDMANVGQAIIYQLPSLIASTTTPCVANIEPGDDGVKGTADDKKMPCNFVWKVYLFPPTEEECMAVPQPPGCPRPTMGPTATYPNRGKQGLLVDVYYTDWGKAKDGLYENGTPFPVSGADIVINGLAVNFAKLPQLARVEFERAGLVGAAHDNLTGKARAYVKFFVYLAFHAILSMAVGLILIAFAAVLLMRVAIIWLCVAFMPFIFVGYAWKGALGDLGHEKMPNIWQKFIKYALLPVFVAIPLSVGFTLLSFSGYLSTISSASMMNSIEVKGLKGLLTDISEIHELIWLLLTLGIIWTGTFSVLESDELSAKVVGGIKGVGETGMNIAKKSLLYAPVIPFPGKGGGMMGVGDVMDIGKRAGGGKGLWDMKDIMDARARGPAPGTSSFPPPPDRTRAIANSNIDPRQFQELITILKNTRASNATPNLEAFAQKLEEITHGKVDSAGHSVAVTKDQAKAIALSPTDMNHFLEGLQQKNIINQGEADELRKNSQHLVNDAYKTKVNLVDGDKTLAQIIQKTKNSLQSNVPVDDAIKALTAHSNIRNETGKIPEATEIKKVIDALQNAARSGGDPKQALDAL